MTGMIFHAHATILQHTMSGLLHLIPNIVHAYWYRGHISCFIGQVPASSLMKQWGQLCAPIPHVTDLWGKLYLKIVLELIFVNKDWYLVTIAKFKRVSRHKWHRSNEVPVIFEICLKDDSKCINYSHKAIRLSYLQVFMQRSLISVLVWTLVSYRV